MIEAPSFIRALEASGVGFFTGVPDSLLSSFSAALDGAPPERHLIAANEGAALALAAGYHLATGGLPLVYLQNSGLGNLVNPLSSLVDETVYAIPVILLVGWRGQPGTKDESQHARMGEATIPVLEALGVPVFRLPQDVTDPGAIVSELCATTIARSAPVALVVEKGAFGEMSLPQQTQYPLDSTTVIERIGARLPAEARVVCSTGKIGRVFYAWNGLQETPREAFLNAGAMGHAGSLAAALALHSNRPVWLFDGDGALLMQLGALALIGQLQRTNLQYIVLNNGAHESVGRQPTLGFHADFCALARACGFTRTRRIESSEELDAWLAEGPEGGAFVEIRISTVVPSALPRPAGSFRDAGRRFRDSFKNGSR